jgi:acyl dehydratase
MELTEPGVFIENRTFDEIAPSETASLPRTLSRADIELFAVMSGDVNPAHVDEEYAHSDMFHAIIAHGMWGASLISALMGTKLPGPGAIYLEQTLRFRHPVLIGDTITVSVTAADKEPQRKRISLDCRCVNQRGSPLAAASVHPSTRETWIRRGERLMHLQRAFPEARFDRVIRRLTELDADDFQRLVATVTWLDAHPTSGLMLRQLPIEEWIPSGWAGTRVSS